MRIRPHIALSSHLCARVRRCADNVTVGIACAAAAASAVVVVDDDGLIHSTLRFTKTHRRNGCATSCVCALCGVINVIDEQESTHRIVIIAGKTIARYIQFPQ